MKDETKYMIICVLSFMAILILLDFCANGYAYITQQDADIAMYRNALCRMQFGEKWISTWSGDETVVLCKYYEYATGHDYYIPTEGIYKVVEVREL